MSKAALSTISPLFIVVNLLVPTLANTIIAKNPMKGFLWGIYAKMVLASCSVLIVVYLQFRDHAAKNNQQQTEFAFPAMNEGIKSIDASPSLLVLVYFLLLCSEAAGTLVFSSVMSFFSRISDPTIGGSSMTLFNTAMNLGSKWPAVLSLYLIPKLTFSHCELSTNHNYVRIEASCRVTQRTISTECDDINGRCIVDHDGYTVITMIFILCGIAWYLVFDKKIKHLQTLPPDEYQAKTQRKQNMQEE